MSVPSIFACKAARRTRPYAATLHVVSRTKHTRATEPVEGHNATQNHMPSMWKERVHQWRTRSRERATRKSALGPEYHRLPSGRRKKPQGRKDHLQYSYGEAVSLFSGPCVPQSKILQRILVTNCGEHPENARRVSRKTSSNRSIRVCNAPLSEFLTRPPAGC